MALFSRYREKVKIPAIHLLVILPAILFSSCELLVDAITDDSVDTLVYSINETLTTISLREDMDMEIIESDENQIIIDGPKRIIENFTITNDKGNLSLNFDKGNGWMYDKPKVQLRIPVLCKIDLFGDNILTATDTLRTPTINIYSRGSNDITLIVNCKTLKIHGNNVCDFYVSGKAENLNVTTSYGSAFYGPKLFAEKVTCNIKGSNHQVVYPMKLLKCNMEYSGNVYYVNQPEEIQTTYNEHGIGKIIFDSSRR